MKSRKVRVYKYSINDLLFKYYKQILLVCEVLNIIWIDLLLL